MIAVTRLNGRRFYLNAEKVQMVEQTPDTVITLTSGEKYVVRESVQEVIARLLSYQRRIHQNNREEKRC